MKHKEKEHGETLSAIGGVIGPAVKAAANENPMGTDGSEFVEYTAPNPELLGMLFEQMRLSAVAGHRSKDGVLYRQGRVNFIVNREADSFAQSFARVHGPSVCAFAIRVKNAAKAYQRALELGAKPHHGPVGPTELNIDMLAGYPTRASVAQDAPTAGLVAQASI